MGKEQHSVLKIEGNTCPVGRTLEIIGDRWTLLILRDCFKKKYTQFQQFLEADEKISPAILSSRLKKLVHFGILEMKIYSDHPPRYEYILTHIGYDLGPILQGLWDWGKKYTKP